MSKCTFNEELEIVVRTVFHQHPSHLFTLEEYFQPANKTPEMNSILWISTGGCVALVSGASWLVGGWIFFSDDASAIRLFQQSEHS